ncbi:MAG TPA: hypothetical protein VGI43_05010 [Mucilaginibacter sp.]
MFRLLKGYFKTKHLTVKGKGRCDIPNNEKWCDTGYGWLSHLLFSFVIVLVKLGHNNGNNYLNSGYKRQHLADGNMPKTVKEIKVRIKDI